MIDRTLITAHPFGSFPPFLASDFDFKIAHSQDELEGFWNLRHRVFCEEQGLFEESDRDGIDRTMIPIVCESLLLGMMDEVAGAVRIYEREPGVWWGGRLCVDPAYRGIPHLSPGVSRRHNLPPKWQSLGAALIYKAVTTAHERGCHTFLATVQSQNAKFFKSLYWEALQELEVFGRPHVKMRADLRFYPRRIDRLPA